MSDLPSETGTNEIIRPWNLRETIFDTGSASAYELEEWQQALDFNEAVVASKRTRGVSDYELAYTAFNDYAPLMRLGRLDDAEQLLAACQQVFEDNGDLDQLGNIFGARSDLEAERGNLAASLAFQKTAIRYHYLYRDPQDIAADHNNLASALRTAGVDPAAQRAHRLAAAMIRQLTGMTHHLFQTCGILASELRAADGHLPETVPEVVAIAEQTEGVKLGELIAALAAPGSQDAVRCCADQRPGQSPPSERHLQEWEPVIARTLAAAGGDRAAIAALEPELDQFAGNQEWAALVAVLRRILGGERGEHLLDGLDLIDTAIAGQVLARLAPPTDGNQQ